ncbi:MAG TPA: DUF5655 domain-containing protein [Anaerolineae bacterium]|nr:DUF5655 domain-containing protein [Anaerolineae bacterium]
MPTSDSVKFHFAGKSPIVQRIYDRLLTILRKFGPVIEEPKKTSIHLVNVSALAGVEVRQNYLLLNIKTDYPIDSPRVERAEKISARRYHQRVRLTALSDLDTELKQWLKDAYALSGAKSKSID